VATRTGRCKDRNANSKQKKCPIIRGKEKRTEEEQRLKKKKKPACPERRIWGRGPGKPKREIQGQGEKGIWIRMWSTRGRAKNRNWGGKSTMLDRKVGGIVHETCQKKLGGRR